MPWEMHHQTPLFAVHYSPLCAVLEASPTFNFEQHRRQQRLRKQKPCCSGTVSPLPQHKQLVTPVWKQYCWPSHGAHSQQPTRHVSLRHLQAKSSPYRGDAQTQSSGTSCSNACLPTVLVVISNSPFSSIQCGHHNPL